jgi:hypothetical protein
MIMKQHILLLTAVAAVISVSSGCVSRRPDGATFHLADAYINDFATGINTGSIFVVAGPIVLSPNECQVSIVPQDRKYYQKSGTFDEYFVHFKLSRIPRKYRGRVYIYALDNAENELNTRVALNPNGYEFIDLDRYPPEEAIPDIWCTHRDIYNYYRSSAEVPSQTWTFMKLYH